MTFLCSDSKGISETGRSWSRFELKSFGSKCPVKKEEPAGFVQLRAGDGAKVDFIPFGKEEKEGRDETKAGSDMLQSTLKKVAHIEQEAYEKGFAQGEKDGFELGEKRAAKVVANIENILIELKRLREQIPRIYEKEILDLVFTIAGKIVHREIVSNREALKETIINSLKLAVEKSEVVLSVNPEDFEYVNKLRRQLFAEVKDMKSISVNSDPSITRGGCLLETPHGDIDSTVETQLDKIYRSVEDAFNEAV